jgi:hypothetical protein
MATRDTIGDDRTVTTARATDRATGDDDAAEVTRRI